MSTKQAEIYEEVQNYRTRECIMCGGTFRTHDQFQTGSFVLPEKICMWCATRNDGRLMKRYMLLYEGLKICAFEDGATCDCKGCRIYHTVKKVIEEENGLEY